MKKLIILAALVGAAISTSAQDVAIGVKGGLNIPNITPGGTQTPLSEGYSSRLSWGAGAFAELKFTRTFSLQIGLEYSGQGGKKDGHQALPSSQYISNMTGNLQTNYAAMVTNVAQASPTGAAQLNTFSQTMMGALAGLEGQMPDYLYADYKSTTKFNYLMIPVQAKFGWNLSPNSPWRVYVQGGLFGSYMFSAKRYMEGSSLVYMDGNNTQTLGQAFQGAMAPLSLAMGNIVTDPTAFAAVSQFMNNLQTGLSEPSDFTRTQDIKDDVRSFNFGFIGAAGFNYNFATRHNIFIEGGGNYGFIKLQKNKDNGQNRIGAGSVMLGYSFNL